MCGRCGFRLPNPELHSPGLQLQVEQLTQRYNEMYSACEKLKQDQIGLDEFAEFLKVWGASLQRELPRDLMIDDDIEEHEPDTAVVQEIDPNFQHFAAGLDVIRPILEDEDFDRLDRGLQIMAEGNEQILGLKPEEEAPTTVDTAREVSCVLCGARNTAGDTVCAECGAKLPRATANSAELAHKPLTGRLQQFRQACDQVLSGKWSMKEFGAFLETMSETLRTKREVYTGALGDYAEFATEEVELASQGMNDFEQGMEELWNYIESKDKDSIHRAMELITSGNDKINKAMALNRASRSDLADEFGYV